MENTVIFIRKYKSLYIKHSCAAFSDGLSPEEVNQLKAEMASVGEIGTFIRFKYFVLEAEGSGLV